MRKLSESAKRHCACDDFLGSGSFRSASGTYQAAPHSQSSHSLDNLSAILECQAESSTKDSKGVSESTLLKSHRALESALLDSYLLLESCVADSKPSLESTLSAIASSAIPYN